MTGTKSFRRKKSGKVLMGLCSGLGEYFKIDPIIIRLAFLCGFFILQTGLALLLFYIIASLIVPYEEKSPSTN
ncbi:MAG TPA: PspC domain-containing protein [bacterium]|jgi:phage shock protein PspC (stress-responsive transcriptional regulator)